MSRSTLIALAVLIVCPATSIASLADSPVDSTTAGSLLMAFDGGFVYGRSVQPARWDSGTAFSLTGWYHFSRNVAVGILAGSAGWDINLDTLYDELGGNDRDAIAFQAFGGSAQFQLSLLARRWFDRGFWRFRSFAQGSVGFYRENHDIEAELLYADGPAGTDVASISEHTNTNRIGFGLAAGGSVPFTSHSFLDIYPSYHMAFRKGTFSYWTLSIGFRVDLRM